MCASKRLVLLLVVSLALTACDDRRSPAATNSKSATVDPSSPGNVGSGTDSSDWKLERAANRTILRHDGRERSEFRIICSDKPLELLVNVRNFRAVGSEERMTFGSNQAVETIVADVRGDRERGGVTGKGAIPRNLKSLLSGPISVNYGNQTVYARTAPDERMVERFAASCFHSNEAEGRPGDGVSACLMQDGEKLDVASFRAVGTEPFWNAKVEGRCVTYSHPDHIAGSRIWTRYETRTGDAGHWTGALEKRRFELAIRPKNGCSDGMSDRVYRYEAELVIGGERRRGCAEVALARSKN